MNHANVYNFQHVEPGAEIVAMTPYKDMIIVATRQNIYVLKDGHISLMEFEIQEIARRD